MVGSASSKYFEGLLFIVVRRPYQVGDGIAVSDVNEYVISRVVACFLQASHDLIVCYAIQGTRA